jgi:hypothetical protein
MCQSRETCMFVWWCLERHTCTCLPASGLLFDNLWNVCCIGIFIVVSEGHMTIPVWTAKKNKFFNWSLMESSLTCYNFIPQNNKAANANYKVFVLTRPWPMIYSTWDKYVLFSNHYRCDEILVHFVLLIISKHVVLSFYYCLLLGIQR